MVFDVFEINSRAGFEKYSSLLYSLGSVDPYSLIDYVNIFSDGLDNLICFSFCKENAEIKIIMIGYLRPISIGNEITTYFDFITPYGYTGPIISPNAEGADIIDFWEHVDRWHRENSVVSEFVRFNLSNNQLNYSGQIFSTMRNIKGKIIEEQKQWISFDRKVRKNYNRAIREKLISEVHYIDISEDKIMEFYDIYTRTMIRTNAKVCFFL